MSLLIEFKRVTRARKCPVCSRPDWCLVSRDDDGEPSRAICARVESPRRFAQAGWLHVLRERGTRWDGVRRRTVDLPTALDERFAFLAERYREKRSERPLAMLAQELGVSVQSLERLGVGWTGSSWSFPMHDDAGRVIGISLRRPDGRKLAVKGSRLGAFLPRGVVVDEPRLLVCEGQSDTAACLDLGFPAIGRAGALSATRIVCNLVRRLRPREVAVVGDRDVAGTKGAAALAAALAATCTVVRVVHPPEGVKDAREWKKSGATRVDIEGAIQSSATVELTVRVRHAEVCS